MDVANPRPLLSRSLVIAFAAHSLLGVNLGLYTFVPVFVRGMDGSKALAGTLGGLAFGAGILARPIVGPLLDRAGRRWSLWLGGVLAIGAAALYPSIDSLGPQIYIARVVTGLADGVLFTAYFTYAADMIPAERRVQGLALFGLSGLLPMSVAPVIGEWIIDHHSYAALFYTLVGVTSASFAISLFLAEPLPASKTDQPEDERALTRGARYTPSLAWLSVLACALGLAMGCAMNFVPAAAREAATRIAWFTIPYGVMAAVIRIGGMRLPDLLGATAVAGPALASYGFGLLLLAINQNAPTLLIAGGLCGIGHGYGFPALAGLGARYAPPGRRGSVMAYLTGLMDLFIFLPAWPLGRLADVNHYGTLFTAGGAFTVLLALIWMWRLPGMFNRASP